MPQIDFANVRISLRQFQAVSSGTYNAGEIRRPRAWRRRSSRTT